MDGTDLDLNAPPWSRDMAAFVSGLLAPEGESRGPFIERAFAKGEVARASGHRRAEADVQVALCQMLREEGRLSEAISAGQAAVDLAEPDQKIAALLVSAASHIHPGDPVGFALLAEAERTA